MRKVDNGKKEKENKKKIMSFLVATNVVASRLTERRRTGTPDARAQGCKKFKLSKILTFLANDCLNPPFDGGTNNGVTISFW